MKERRKSNIGKILRGLHKDESDKVSVVSVINKACAGGVTTVGAFSIRSIKECLKGMYDMLSKDDFDRDNFFSAFSTLYSLVMAPDNRAKGVFHPSQLLDGCTRQMAYELSGEKPTNAVGGRVGPELQRTFDVGTWYHIYMQNILYRTGLLKQAEVPVINKSRYINGKADGVFKDDVFGEKVVLEIKTMNSWSFSKAIFKPFKKHEFQASLYARELGAKKVLYLYINKDTSEIREFLMPVNDEQLAIADEKMDTVIDSVANGKPLPKRSCTNALSDDALNCPFASLCFKK